MPVLYKKDIVIVISIYYTNWQWKPVPMQYMYRANIKSSQIFTLMFFLLKSPKQMHQKHNCITKSKNGGNQFYSTLHFS